MALIESSNALTRALEYGHIQAAGQGFPLEEKRIKTCLKHGDMSLEDGEGLARNRDGNSDISTVASLAPTSGHPPMGTSASFWTRRLDGRRPACQHLRPRLLTRCRPAPRALRRRVSSTRSGRRSERPGQSSTRPAARRRRSRTRLRGSKPIRGSCPRRHRLSPPPLFQVHLHLEPAGRRHLLLLRLPPHVLEGC